MRDAIDSWGLALHALAAPEQHVHLWILDLPASQAQSAAYQELLSHEEYDRMHRFLFPADRFRYCVSHAALRLIVGASLGRSANDVVFDRTSSGKPILAMDQQFFFNLSHAGRYALIGTSTTAEIGVDIESNRHDIDLLGLAEQSFSSAENTFLRDLQFEDQRHAFFRIWTAKEAILKAIGLGITDHLKSFTVRWATGGLAIEPDPTAEGDVFAKARAYVLAAPEGYAAACALYPSSSRLAPDGQVKTLTSARPQNLSQKGYSPASNKR